MRLLPRSLYGRLLALSALATLAALVFAAFAISAVLERFVIAGLDDRLDAQIALLASAVKPNGSIDSSRAVVAAPYDDPHSGWGWRIDAPRAHITSPSAPDTIPDIEAPLPSGPHPDDGPPPPGPGPHRHDRDDRSPRPFDWHDADGIVRHARSTTIETTAGTATIVAAAPRAIVERPIRAAMAPLLGSLALLGVALALATLVQLRLGLRPLTRLRDSVAAIRAGAARHVPADQPAELAPLAAELNALIDQNEAQLASARGHVANLAHGLKTPLATLALGLRDPARDPDGALATEVARIDTAIRHHLGRARSDAAGTASRARTPLAPAVDALAIALARIHADRRVAFDASIDPALTLAVDPQDLDELLGNLLDNAWRHATSRIDVRASAEGNRAQIAIEDDGPGIPADRRAEAVAPGRRLDESGDGHGFGLSIARELAELHGGTLALDESPGGGLTASLTLPLTI